MYAVDRQASTRTYEGCGECQTTMPYIVDTFRSERHVVHMHVDFTALEQSVKKCEKSRQFVDKFFKIICSLRNSRGGLLVVHVTDKNNYGPSLDMFDQKVAKELYNMIADDSPYSYNFTREWFRRDHKHDSSHILVTVKGSSTISTKNFNTMTPFDGSKERPKPREIARFLSDDIKYGESRRPNLRQFAEGSRVDIIESRSVQFKGFHKSDLDKDTKEHQQLAGKLLSERIVFRLIHKLDLLHYITAFTKLTQGGSIFFGIEEEKQSPKSTATPKDKSARALDFSNPRDTYTSKQSTSESRYQYSTYSTCTHGERSRTSEKESVSPSQRRMSRRRKGGHSPSPNETIRKRPREESPPYSEKRPRRDREKTTSQNLSERGYRERTAQDGRQTETLRRSHRVEKTMPDKSSSGDRTTNRCYSKRREHEYERQDRHQARQGSEYHGSKPRTQHDKRPSSLHLPSHASVASTSRNPDTSSPYRRETSREYSIAGTSSNPSTPKDRPGTIKTGHHVVRGFDLEECEKGEISNSIMKTICDMMWITDENVCTTVVDAIKRNSNAITVIFHPTGKQSKKFVLEVRVEDCLPGLVFFTKEGPESYKINESGEIETIPTPEWSKLMKRAILCSKCDRYSEDDKS